jgi:alpha-glucosidase
MFQMASVIVFSSPFLCLPDNPDAYLNSPLLQFIRSVPASWDETRVLPGSVIGDTVIIGRRAGEAWYVGLLNCRQESRTVQLDLSSLDFRDKELTLYRDGPDRGSSEISSGVRPPANGRIDVALEPGGGLVAQLRPTKLFHGWR